MLNDFNKMARESYAKNHRMKMMNFEREAIAKTLRDCNCNISETARWLGYSRQHLYRKMKELGIMIAVDRTSKRQKVKALRAFAFNAEERAILNDLLHVWLVSCSTKHNDCNACPRQPEKCTFIADRMIDRIYDKTGMP